MNYVNSPDKLPTGVCHTTYYSKLYGHDLGYAVYLPADYETGNKTYPVHYHFHGWQGCETSDISAMEPVYRNRETIFVFPNVSFELGEQTDLPVERMFFEELIPEIEGKYRISSENRTISGFSMGGGMAVWYALKHPGMFSDVIAYAGTFHHYYHKDYMTAFVPVERAEELYHGMRETVWESDRNLLAWFDRTPADAFRLRIRIGTEDPLYCDAEVLHRHLLSLEFPHEYKIIDKAGHTLADIV
ncbi:MAG: hypothetical protein IJ480_12095 [Clostridia bacterium]|nr:hypothetical protein [Clostridia bacterium]